MHGPHRRCSARGAPVNMLSASTGWRVSTLHAAPRTASLRPPGAGPSYNGSSSASMQIGGTSSVAVAAPVTMSAGVPSDAGTNRNNHASSFLPSTTIDTKVEECKDLPSSMRWSKAITMFGHDERFNAVERSKEREDLFENYLVELENKEKAKAAEERKRRIPEYREFLESCDSVKLQWADASTEWKEFTTAEGRKYYYNKVRKQSKWSIPDELRIARELAGKTSNQQPVWENESTTVAPVGSTSVSVEPSSLPAKQPSSLVGTIASSAHDAIANLPPPGTGLSYNGDISSSGSIQNGGTSAAVVAPEQVLVVMKAKKRMPTAGKINVTPLEDETSEEETVVYANNLEAKNAFKSLLESANVQSDWSWDQAMRAITSDKRYGALKTLGERKQAFNGYLNQRKKIEIEERRVKQRKARDDFLTMLEECKDLTSSMRWSKAITMFGHDERFNAVERFKEREDLFENYLVGLQKKEELRRQERKNCDEFRKMMEEHVADGTLNARTYWRDYCSQVKDSRAYLAVVSNLSGLTPKELFDDAMEELDKQYQDDMTLIKDEVKSGKVTYEDKIERLKEKDLKEAKKRQRLGDNCLDLRYSIKGIMVIAFALLIHKGAAQIPTETITFNASDGIGYRTSLDSIRSLILTDTSCGIVGTHYSLPETPANPADPPERIIKIELFYGPDPTPKAALYMRWDSLYIMAVAEESGVVHYFSTYESIFQSFEDSQVLPYEESYAGLTGTEPNDRDPVYPKIADIFVGRASAQNAIEFISTPAIFTMENTREGILTMILMIPESLRIKSVAAAWESLWDTVGTLTEESAKEITAWSALSQLYEKGSFEGMSDRNFKKIKRLRPKVTTQEQAGNLIDLVYKLKPQIEGPS